MFCWRLYVCNWHLHLCACPGFTLAPSNSTRELRGNAPSGSSVLQILSPGTVGSQPNCNDILPTVLSNSWGTLACYSEQQTCFSHGSRPCLIGRPTSWRGTVCSLSPSLQTKLTTHISCRWVLSCCWLRAQLFGRGERQMQPPSPHALGSSIPLTQGQLKAVVFAEQKEG